MKRKRIMTIIGVLLLITIIASQAITSAASSKVVTMNGTGTIAFSATDPGTNIPYPGGSAGTISRIDNPGTGDRTDVGFNLVVFLFSLVVLLLLLLIKWHWRDTKCHGPQTV